MEAIQPRVYALICTRKDNPSSLLTNLTSYLSRAGVEVKLLQDQESMFSGYQKGFESIKNPHKDDIVILCHDDIQILIDPSYFVPFLNSHVGKGFSGPAGTTLLREDCVWWDYDRWKEGHHRGYVWHGKKIQESNFTNYGPPGQVLVLDGLFLACRVSTINKIGGLGKPDYLTEDWDYYDLHYTMTADSLGLRNYAIPLPIVHGSSGSLDNRDSWHKNRELFRNKWFKQSSEKSIFQAQLTPTEID